MTMLSLDDVSVSYGPLTAVRNVSLDIGRGEIVFLAGPNGAGKSTLMRAIAGVLAPSQGKITVAGKSTAGMRSEAVVRLGFTLVPEGREIFGSLSVAENLSIGAYLRRDRAGIEEDMDFVLSELPALKPRLRDAAGLLSGGQQQMLAIGRALMTRAPMIAIDEPSLGLAPKLIDQVYDILLALREKRDLTLLIAEQSFMRAVEVDARLVMLRSGHVVRAGRARDLAAERSLEGSFFGFEGAAA
ncbi:ABC transporter ATP-binding protein [Mesorhizobium sp. CU2]|uniref:ABC transporter ATP-binding protein n=1 Tax=unclassified Mesorhizobium TaxID=325217 RepID=UPI001125CDA4|nr:MULTISPECIES: ABC transporter ATP-binding protein [unclassified Mesorhizobium]TPN85594.1 ABC transporter ATP-binding protein [Mesorhizobium sp. CU3]TPO02659.1 ABC transporter ATP-binding protein [Mesorhizobium sp. CU2]